MAVTLYHRIINHNKITIINTGAKPENEYQAKIQDKKHQIRMVNKNVRR